MRLFYSLTNFFIILVFCQIYNFFSIFRFHFLIFLLISCLIGILLGAYFSFTSNTHVIPHLDTNMNKNIFKYKIYTDLTKILNKLQDESISSFLNKNMSFNKNLAKSDSSLLKLNEKFLSNEHKMNYNNQISICSEDIIEEYLDNDNEHDINSESQNESHSKFESYLENIIELVVKDFIIIWLDKLVWDKDKLALMAKNELKQILASFRKKLRNLDYVKIISSDLINIFSQHFFNVRKSSNLKNKFQLNLYEINSEKEKEHLRNIIEILILNIFQDKIYFKNSAVRSLLREIILNKELICDPDYLNQKIVNYLINKENLKNSLARKFLNAPTYEDFIKMIRTSNNIEEIKELHYNLMNEIMQATIISDFKTSKSTENANSSSSTINSGIINCGSSSFYVSFSGYGSETDAQTQLNNQASSSKSLNNSHTDKNKTDRNLKKYIKQLRHAKILCQRRLQALNSSTIEDDENYENKLKNRKILPLETVLESSKGINNFLKYLEIDGSDALLRFWIDVEKMKKLKPNNIKKKYELANSIYENYLKNYDSPVRDEIGKELCKSMKLFLIGNSNEECFFKAQEKIKLVLEKDNYPSFLVTDLYENFLKEFDTESQNKLILNEEENNNFVSINNKPNIELNTQGYDIDMNKKQINVLKEKLNIKLSALNAIKSNNFTQEDSKIVEILDKDIKNLQHDILVYQNHIMKTELWCENIGKWTTCVTSARTKGTDDLIINGSGSNSEYSLLFEIHVQLLYDETSKENDKNNFKEGWIIYRTFKQFESLNESLHELIPNELKNKFKKASNFLKRNLLTTVTKSKDEKIIQVILILDEYLKVLSEDSSLAQSDALYTFLCPSPDYFKNKTSQSNNEDKFTISHIFKSFKQKEINEDEYLDELFSENNLKSIDSNERDSIAEPFYVLIEEIFELKGMKKLFRKSLILFVQLTYGATINRKIRESIYWSFNDEMLAFYLKQIKDTFWSLNEIDNCVYLIKFENKERTFKDKIETKKLARLKLCSNIPETLQKLVGEKNAQIGFLKLFEMFQDKKLNKHLVYSILDMFINELFPDD